MIDQNAIKQPVVSFSFGRNSDGDEAESSVSFGSIDSSRYTGSLIYFSLTETKYWEIAFNGFRTMNGTVDSLYRKAVVDTGTTLMVLPYDEAQALYSSYVSPLSKRSADF